MMKILIPGLLALSVAVMAAATHDTEPFKITTRRENDRVVMKAEPNKVVFSFQSPVGISNAIIERMEKKWPDSIVLRLHLSGLENLQIKSGKAKLETSISSQDNTVRLWKDGKEESLLDSNSRFWMEVRKMGIDGKPVKTSPLKDGYFEMVLPKALLEENPKSISVHWVDFFR